MKLHITPFIDRFTTQEPETKQDSLDRFYNALIPVSVRKRGQTIELQDYQSVRVQIDSVLESPDIDTLLDPAMPNVGSMEVFATIKRDLTRELENLLLAQKN